MYQGSFSQKIHEKKGERTFRTETPLWTCLSFTHSLTLELITQSLSSKFYIIHNIFSFWHIFLTFKVFFLYIKKNCVILQCFFVCQSFYLFIGLSPSVLICQLFRFCFFSYYLIKEWFPYLFVLSLHVKFGYASVKKNK